MKSITYLLLLGILATVSPSLGQYARSGAVSVSFEETIYIIGGRTEQPVCSCSNENFDSTNEVLVYSRAVEDFVPENQTLLSVPRAFHTATLINSVGKIFVFGGHASNNDLEVFDIGAGTWSIANVSDDDRLPWTAAGKRPSARHSHAAGYVTAGSIRRLYIFGGIDAESGNALNDLWYYDIITQTWGEITNLPVSPSPRAGATVWQTFSLGFVIFGGYDTNVVPRYLNTVWRFVHSPSQAPRWTHITPEDSPSPRAYASGATVSLSKFYLFGGETPNRDSNGTVSTNYHNDIYEFWLTAGEWRKLEFAEGSLPAPRSAAAAVWNSHDAIMQIFFGRNTEQSFADSWEVATDFVNGPGYANQIHQTSCLTGHHFPSCQLDCSGSNWCNGHGLCVAPDVCCCDAGWAGEGLENACSENPCDGYRGFDTETLNQILLPKSFESTFNKLDIISNKLKNVRDLLPSIEAHQVDMEHIAKESYNFFHSCLVDRLCPVSECFEDLVGCDAACGDETFCIVGDHCHNGQCVNGTTRDCGQDFKDNKCVNSWCDETYGCMHSAVVCEESTGCSNSYCDPTEGCVVEQITCDDNDCCTDDKCEDGICTHQAKCEDWNPCTIDTCKNDCDHSAECSWEFETGCWPNKGANNAKSCPFWDRDRPLGNPLIYTSAAMVPSQYPSSDLTPVRSARGYFWLRENDCELIYDISFSSALEIIEDGAHFYGPASSDENAGVLHTLKAGAKKQGVWNFCEDGITASTVLNGEIYSTIYFKGADVRVQIEFETELREDCLGGGDDLPEK